MNKDNVLQFEGRETITTDALTQLLKSGAQQMLQVAIEAEVQEFMLQFQDRLLNDGRVLLYCLSRNRTPSQTVFDGQATKFITCMGYNEGQQGEYRKQTVEVHSFAPNPWGLYQMHGNVLEWCSDLHGQYENSKQMLRDPKGSYAGYERVLRGGSWNFSGRILRSARRSAVRPDVRSLSAGFRLSHGSPETKEKTK